MTMNRIQIQAGLLMPEFFEYYGPEAQCQAALQAARWLSGFVCPNCGGTARSHITRGGLPYLQSGARQHQTGLIIGTISESRKLSLRRWFLALHLLTRSNNNVSALELKRPFGVGYRAA